jgi:hypothetical protein
MKVMIFIINKTMEKLTGLSKSEIKTVKFIISFLRTQRTWTTGETILHVLNTTDIRKKLSIDYVITPSHIRNFINIIRSESLAAVVSSRLGYKISRKELEIKKQIASMQHRIDAMNDAIDGLKRILNK